MTDEPHHVPLVSGAPREHWLKTWPDYWEAVATGGKNFEVRRDDRGFQKGDILVLRKFNPATGSYVMGGKSRWDVAEVRRRVTWILTGGQFGIEAGYVVMGLADAADAAQAAPAPQQKE